jgi:hypothetical protein
VGIDEGADVALKRLGGAMDAAPKSPALDTLLSHALSSFGIRIRLFGPLADRRRSTGWARIPFVSLQLDDRQTCRMAQSLTEPALATRPGIGLDGYMDFTPEG